MNIFHNFYHRLNKKKYFFSICSNHVFRIACMCKKSIIALPIPLLGNEDYLVFNKVARWRRYDGDIFTQSGLLRPGLSAPYSSAKPSKYPTVERAFIYTLLHVLLHYFVFILLHREKKNDFSHHSTPKPVFKISLY